ncbi:hypothetical protein QMK34_40795, partial [Amycolatopsis sp. H20-H5]
VIDIPERLFSAAHTPAQPTGGLAVLPRAGRDLPSADTEDERPIRDPHGIFTWFSGEPGTREDVTEPILEAPVVEELAVEVLAVEVLAVEVLAEPEAATEPEPVTESDRRGGLARRVPQPLSADLLPTPGPAEPRWPADPPAERALANGFAAAAGGNGVRTVSVTSVLEGTEEETPAAERKPTLVRRVPGASLDQALAAAVPSGEAATPIACRQLDPGAERDSLNALFGGFDQGLSQPLGASRHDQAAPDEESGHPEGNVP